jgi:hypothetical protein
MLRWCQQSNLIINTKKTLFINFHTSRRKQDRNPLIKIQGRSIAAASETKFLGIIINETLNWSSHIDHVAKKLSTTHFLIRNIRDTVSIGTVRLVYFGFVYSHISHGIIFWGGSKKANRIFILQKKAVRAMVGATRNRTCRPIFKTLGIMTLPAIFINETILYGIQHGRHIQNNQIHDHHTRGKLNFNVPKNKKVLSDNSPAVAGIKFYNRLPEFIKKESSVKCFKTLLKNFLTTLCPYSVDEFLNNELPNNYISN